MCSPAQEFRFAWRQIRRAPLFSAFIVALMAIGIGFNLSVFSLVDALLLQPLPVRNPNELVRFVQVMPNIDPRSVYPFQFYEAMRQNTKMCSDVIADSNLTTAVRDESGVVSRVRCQIVSGNYFTALGISALHGRVLTEGDELLVSDTLPVVFSYPYWQSRFLGDPAIIGKQIRLNDVPFMVVGVLPQGFNGLRVETGPDVRAPLIASDRLEIEPQVDSYRKQIYEVAARLRPGTGVRQAEAEAQSIFSSALRDEDRRYYEDERLEARPIPKGYSVLREKYFSALVLLMAGVALVLLIIYTNVGGLLLARASAQMQDSAVRLALGATPGRIIRQWLAQSFLLATLGTASGLCIFRMMMPLLVRGLPPVRDLDTTILRLSLNLKLDARLLVFSIGLCFAGALLAGVPPALQAAHSDLYAKLRAARPNAPQKLRWVLVGLQAGLCTVLLGGTTLLIGTFRNLAEMDPGFSRDNVITFSADPWMLAYTPTQAESLKSRLLASVREMPEVESDALSSVGIMRGTGLKTTVAPAGQRPTRNDFLNTSIHFVTQEYFETMGIRLVEGRIFRPDEPAAKPIPAVVNSTFARRFFHDTDAIGRTFGIGLNEMVPDEFVVIGVASDAKYRSLREPVPPTFYEPWSSARRMGFILHVRTRGRPESLIEPVRRALYAIDPRLPFYNVRTLRDEVRDSIWPERALAWLATLFSVAAAGLAIIAVYGTLSYAITQGKREIGIRIALGARRADVFMMNSVRPMAVIGAAVIMGIAAFYAVIPSFNSVLYGISPTDPLSIATAAVIVLSLGLAATFSASRKALHVDPAEVLRGE